ncbi:DNA/RNA non-specific endonuclease [Metabacillus malikii]|uniref:Type VII secretion system protein EssD-like domain-containing protein n=1 Tax=Metabacillus malikii TaxID=1504265 RepID=A0ABT9ZLI1_9BACI|nr:DNA/RNA non-specific endonuclease [Metabacillus malikii]MDQ0233143.1 hypothetical protein [Metabacillus malikii]
MKQDLKINYGILDGIIEQLRTYKNALDTMDSSLETLVGFINNNYADSIDAWDELVKDSKKHIKEYREQIGDLLSLFEGYVDDTTAHISPIARNAMMRVDRRDIWMNLCQLESGINNNVPKAIRITKNEPFSLAFWDDPTDEEKEKSRSNKAKLDYIRGEISSTQTILDRKMDALWNIFDNKIVPYENTDDAYNNKAAAVKSKYTNFFEGIIDQFEQDIKVATSFIKGLVEGIVDILVGIVTIVVDASIVAVSNHIPDTIEPDFIKNPANEVKAKYGKMISDAIEDPFGIFESIGQGISDTVEEEGIAYIAGNAAPSLIPYVGVVGKAKWLKAVDNGDGPKTNSVTEALKPKVNDLVRNNKAFEGIKQRGVEVVTKTANGAIHVVKQLDKGINSVRNGLVYVADNVVGGIDVFIDIMKRNGNIDNNAVYVNVPNKPNVPWNVLDNKVIQENIVAPLKMMFSKLSGGGKGDRVDDGGMGNRLSGDSEIKPLVGKGEQYTNGRKNRLKPNIRYQTGEYDYFYETDNLGRISKFEADNLQLTDRGNRLSHSRNTLGKIKGKDHAGHLAADRFGGSPKIDNLVSQLSDVNLRRYKKVEDEWAAALKETPPKEVKVNVEIKYVGKDARPSEFIVEYEIDGKYEELNILNRE